MVVRVFLRERFRASSSWRAVRAGLGDGVRVEAGDGASSMDTSSSEVRIWSSFCACLVVSGGVWGVGGRAVGVAFREVFPASDALAARVYLALCAQSYFVSDTTRLWCRLGRFDVTGAEVPDTRTSLVRCLSGGDGAVGS